MLKAARMRFLLLTACVALLSNTLVQATNYKDDAAPGLADAAGVWVNMWNWPEGDLDGYCRDLSEHRIRNIFLQTSRSNTQAIINPPLFGKIIEAAHKHGVRVIAWSFAELQNPLSDAGKMVEAAEYTSPHGQHVDAASANLEKNLEPARIKSYAQSIREKLGANYPLIAVVYSPLNKCSEVKRISWPLLAQYFDVIAPMIYWNSKYEKIEPYSYTVKSIQKIRELSAKADIEISAIGDGMGSNSAAINDFMRACRDAEATGISLYPNQKITLEQKEAVAQHLDYLKPNARFRLAAFREYARQGNLNPPPAFDPSKPITRKDLYQLVVRQMYPAFTVSKADGRLAHNSANLPSAAECKEADGQQACQILTELGLLTDLSDTSSIQAALDTPIYADEAVSLIASLLELDKQKLALRQAKTHRLDRWLVPAARAELKEKGSYNNQALNYVDAAHMVLQASSALH